MPPLRRKDLDPRERALSDTLDECLARFHGILATSWAYPSEFIEFLERRGYTIISRGSLDLLKSVLKEAKCLQSELRERDAGKSWDVFAPSRLWKAIENAEMDDQLVALLSADPDYYGASKPKWPAIEEALNELYIAWATDKESEATKNAMDILLNLYDDWLG